MERPLTQHIIPGSAVYNLKDYVKDRGLFGFKENSEKHDSCRCYKPGKGFKSYSEEEEQVFQPVQNGVLYPWMKTRQKPNTLFAMPMRWNPGTFKDRYLLEGNPHQLIEGMIISAYAIQAQTSYIFIRWAYKKAEAILRKAIDEAYEAGYLGQNILGSGFDLDMYVHSSAGRYICGEETALLNSLEGKRAIPRAKPPYPAINGCLDGHTVVNNVETLSLDVTSC